MLLADRIAADIESTRQTARATSTTKSITFNINDQTYTLNGIQNPDKKSGAFIVEMTGYASTARLSGVLLGGDNSLSFNGFGFPDSGGSISITVGQFPRTISVDAATGNTTIF